MKSNRATRRKLSWLAVLLLLVAVVAVGVGVSVRSKAKGPTGHVVTVQKRDMVMAVDEVGMVRPLRRIDIKSKVAGQVAEVLVDVGDRVKKGQELVRLDPTDIRHQLAVTLAKARVERAAVRLARDTLAIRKRAHDKGVLSDLEFSRAQGELRQRQASLAVIEAQAVVLRDQLGYTRLRAPIDGVVLERNIQPGEMVTPGVASLVNGKPLLVIAQVEKMLVRAELNQIDVARVHPNDPVTITVNALPGKTFHGHVYRIAAMAGPSELRNDKSLRVFPVDVLLDQGQEGMEQLRAGIMAHLHIEVGKKSAVLVIPLEAIVHEGEKTRVRKLEGGKEKLVDVTVGYQNDEVAEVVSGLKQGDRIVEKPLDPKEVP